MRARERERKKERNIADVVAIAVPEVNRAEGDTSIYIQIRSCGVNVIWSERREEEDTSIQIHIGFCTLIANAPKHIESLGRGSGDKKGELKQASKLWTVCAS
jgi:hypothetical protein